MINNKNNKEIVGIFTPVHKYNEDHLSLLIESLNKQSNKQFKWLVLLNGSEGLRDEYKIKHLLSETAQFTFQIERSFSESLIGKLKGEACDLLIQDPNIKILLELDYDDALHRDCISELISGFEQSQAKFCFSNFAHFNYTENGEFESQYYSEYYGWKKRDHYNRELFGNNTLNETICYPAVAQYIYRIESAPNHLRAFLVDAYKEVGGYDKSLSVGDDHDLVCRFYIKYGDKGFHHINKCIYYQRYNPSTTTHLRINEIQRQVDLNYIKFSEKIFLKWAKDNNLLSLDLGGRFNCPEGYKSVDLHDADYIMDLNKPWELEDNSVGVIRAYHILEHLEDPIHFFNEAYRVLAPGGFILIEVPSARSYHAFADPTHKSFWTELNFDYYIKEQKAQFIRPKYQGAFQKMRIVEYAWPDDTLCISAQLICLKGWYNDNFWGLKETDEKFTKPKTTHLD